MNAKALTILVMLTLFSCKEKPEEDNTVGTTKDTVSTLPAQPGTEAATVTGPTDPVSSIKAEFARINASSLTNKHYTYKCDELMTIDYYYEGENVVKAVVDYGTVGDHYQKSEFYYKDNKLFFFYNFVEGGPACEGCEMKMEKRYYVKDDLVIKFIKNDKEEKCTTCNFTQRSVPYRALKAATTKDFKTAFCS
jgi:hypothetical protein